jgi:hypothetical protein
VGGKRRWRATALLDGAVRAGLRLCGAKVGARQAGELREGGVED